jgi:class I fructose-bisphosphate aldolase
MISIDDSPIVRDGKSLILAMDHGLEHGPVDFEAIPDKLDPAAVFEMAHSGRGRSETGATG